MAYSVSCYDCYDASLLLSHAYHCVVAYTSVHIYTAAEPAKDTISRIHLRQSCQHVQVVLLCRRLGCDVSASHAAVAADSRTHGRR